MTLLYHDPIFLAHQTGLHPEHPRRLEAITRHLRARGLEARCARPTWDPATLARLELVHPAAYVQQLKKYAEQGGGRIEQDTVVCPRSYEVALWAAGAVADAVERVVGGEDRQALCLVRPPGHHALTRDAMGFCLFNNIAVGARVATHELGLDRVLIVDWDVHHGNGTQAIFWEDARVGFLSIHRFPFYPGSGSEDETGAGPGLGSTLNLPVAWGTSRRDYLDRFERSLGRFAAQLQPQLVFISAGFDAHRADPIGSLGLETEDFGELTRIVLGIAAEHAEGRLVSVLEGGYDPTALGESVALHLETLLDPSVDG